MPLFLISYDLHKVRDYKALYKVLDTDWKSARLLESVRLVELKGPASAIRDLLQGHVDPDDSLVVIELKPGSDWATRHAKEPGVKWLKEKLGT